jgi:hypothetical protein
MGQFERQVNINKSITQKKVGSSNQNQLLAEVACDDRRVQLGVKGSATVGELKRQALGEMQLVSSDPNRYIAIGPNRQPINDNELIQNILSQGQSLEFRLIPQVAFGLNRF